MSVETFTLLDVVVRPKQLSAQAMLVVITAMWLGPHCLPSASLTPLMVPRHCRTQLLFEIPPNYVQEGLPHGEESRMTCNWG